MDKTFLKKFKVLAVLAALSGVCCLLFFVSFLVYLQANSSLNKKTGDAERKLYEYKRTIPLSGHENILEQQTLQANTQEEYIRFKELLIKDASSSADQATPLTFKQRLFDFSENTARQAANTRTRLPEDLGFKEYALKVPDSSTAKILTQELILAEDVVRSLLDSSVPAILSLKLPHKAVTFEAKSMNEPALSLISVSLSVSFEADHVGLRKFLKKLSEKDNVYTIKKMVVQQKSEEGTMLSAELEIENMVLLK